MGFAIGVGACGGGAPAPKAADTAQAAPVAVGVDTAVTEAVPLTLTLTGSVAADKTAEVSANVAGRIILASVERGQRVKQGDTLARVDSESATLSATAATANANAAQSQVELAQKECARADALVATQAITRSEFDRMKTTCTAQLFSAQAAAAQAGLASKAAGDTSIRAPFSGVVGERYVNVGEYVQPASRIASLYAVDPVRVTISVPENALALVKEGQVLNVRVAAYPDQAFPATVKYVAPALRPSTRDLLVEALAPNPQGLLKPGMFATVKLDVGTEERPTVSNQALRVDGTVARVFVVRDGRAVETVVRTGPASATRTALLDGVKTGDVVVVEPPSTLKDGSLVAPRPAG